MKRNIIAIIFAAAAVMGAQSCKKATTPEALNLQPAYKYTDAYYQALRDYKKSDHAISYIFFGDYGTPYSCAFRFAGIPDSMDVVNLWGGVPKRGSLDWEEMHEMRRLKGTKVVCCKITRLTKYNSTWGKDANIPSFMNGYPEGAEGYTAAFKRIYDERIAAGDDNDAATATAETQALEIGRACLTKDMNDHPLRTEVEGQEGKYEYPEWCVYAAKPLIDEVLDNDLDGYDLDYEPEGDPLDGDKFYTFVQYMAEFFGPKSPRPETILIVDRNSSCKSYNRLAEYCNYWIYQKYGGTGGASATTDADYPLSDDPSLGWTNSQVIVTENVGDMWTTGGRVLQHAAFNPSKGGRKGGFACFHGQRDYNTVESGVTNGKTEPYGVIRKAIQLQNPSVKK